MSRLVLSGAALFAAIAAWSSQSTIGFVSPDGPRLALLPLTPVAAAISMAAATAVIALWFHGASLLPVALLGLILLPWLPLPVPSAFLLWVHPLGVMVWLAVLLLMLISVPQFPRFEVSHPRRVAASAAFIIFGLSAWRAAPMLPGGDEPHYLIITQSLLLDGDLTIEDVHLRRDYRAYYTGELAPHVQRRGRNGEIYSIHAPGLPALVAVPFALGGYFAVVLFLILLASAGAALAWHVGWLTTMREDAAWFAWAAVTLPVTTIFQSFTIYPDGPAGVVVLSGLWAILRAEEERKSERTAVRPWLLHGSALAVLPWLHSRFAILAGGLGALVLLRLAATKNPAAKAVAFLSIPAVSAVLWIGFFIAIYGDPAPSAPYGPGELGSLRFVPGGLAGLLFDQRFGLLAYAPVLAVSLVFLGVMLADSGRRRLALELLFVMLPYLVTVTHFAMWWGGWSPPARFFAPILLLLAAPAAYAWTTIRCRASRLFAAASLVATGLTSLIVVSVDRGRLAFNTRDAPALWLEWLGRVADLPSAAPMWSRDADVPLFRAIAVWLVLLVAGWAILRLMERPLRSRRPVVLHVTGLAVLAVVMMTASSVVWKVEGARGSNTILSQLQLLRALADTPRSLGFQLHPLSRVAAPNLPGRMQLELFRRPGARAGAGGGTLFVLPPLPAGEYRLKIHAAAPRGWVMVGISRDPRDSFALRTLQLPADAIDMRFPLPVRALVVRGDEDAWRVVRGLTIEPLSITRPVERLTQDMARRGVRYGSSTVYVLDERVFPEPDGFWVGGGRDTTIVIQPDAPSASATIKLRNAPVQNRVTLTAGAWRQVFQMAPAEEQEVEVPLDPARDGAVLRLESSSGFTPAQHDPGSRDQRYLGVYVRLAGSEQEP